MEYRVRVCPDTGRVFVCGGPSGGDLCEASGHGGRTAEETAELIAFWMNRARVGYPDVDADEAPAGFAAAECRSGCTGCAFWRGTCGLMPGFTAKGFLGLPCHAANRKDGRSVIFVTKEVKAKPPRRRAGRRAEGGGGLPRNVRKEGEG